MHKCKQGQIILHAVRRTHNIFYSNLYSETPSPSEMSLGKFPDSLLICGNKCVFLTFFSDFFLYLSVYKSSIICVPITPYLSPLLLSIGRTRLLERFDYSTGSSNVYLMSLSDFLLFFLISRPNTNCILSGNYFFGVHFILYGSIFI